MVILANASMTFTISARPITKKNSQRIVQSRGRAFILPSKAYTDYEKEAQGYLPQLAEPLSTPVEVKCLFFMPTKRSVDLTNLLEAIDDILVKGGVLADDNCRIIVSHDGSRVLYDKDNPRTEVTIREVSSEE